MNESSVVTSLAALAQEFRLRAFRLLVVAGPEGLTPTQIAESLGVAPNTLSFHLKELMHAELVTQERQGRNLIYRASFTTMDGLIAYLTQNCCQGSACLSTLPNNQTPCC
jgi:ArsR family transcriptional regulator, arsenate/arsenite/antimonite-responsive transcriptional repressor